MTPTEKTALEALAKRWIDTPDGSDHIERALIEGCGYELLALLAEAQSPETEGLRELMKRVADEHPIAGSYDEDARYNWPDRWDALWELAIERASPPVGMKHPVCVKHSALSWDGTEACTCPVELRERVAAWCKENVDYADMWTFGASEEEVDAEVARNVDELLAIINRVMGLEGKR